MNFLQWDALAVKPTHAEMIVPVRDPLVQCQEVARKTRAQRSCNGFADRCSDETAYSTGTESVVRALEVLVNQYDWLRGPLTFRVVKRLRFSAVGITRG
jgi:hypothetical protein